jgi:hypothetical protein
VPNKAEDLYNDLITVKGYAYCDTVNGYRVIGGGFEAFGYPIGVIKSVPVQDVNGWYAEIEIPDGDESANLNIYAICAKIVQ